MKALRLTFIIIIIILQEGLVQFPKSNERMVEVGEQYFDELLSKCFFHKSVTKESCFVMHDLVHDWPNVYLENFSIDLKMMSCKKFLRTFCRIRFN